MVATTELVLSVFIIACTSIGKAALTVAAGVLLTRRGAFTPDVRRGLSKAAASLLVPCLLVERLSRSVTPELLAAAWPIIPVGFLYVGLGCSLGFISAIGTSDEVRRPTIAATAFANSQAMPIILIDVIGPELFGPDAAATAVTYIGLYLTVYLVLQWTIGAALLDVPMLSLGGGEKPAPSEAASHASSSGRRSSSGGGSDNGGSHGGIVYPDGVAMSSVVVHAGSSGGVGASEESAASESVASAVESASGDSRAARRAAAGTANLLSASSGGSGGCDTHSGAGSNGMGGSRGSRSRRSKCAMAFCAVLRRVASPPIYGICAGLCIGLAPPLRWLLVGTHSEEDGAAARAPMRFVMQAAGLLGDAAIPLNTMLLGASLSKGPTWRAVPPRVVTGIVLCKLAIMPTVALGLVALLTAMVPISPLLTLVILIESAMPTANNLMMMY